MTFAARSPVGLAFHRKELGETLHTLIPAFDDTDKLKLSQTLLRQADSPIRITSCIAFVLRYVSRYVSMYSNYNNNKKNRQQAELP